MVPVVVLEQWSHALGHLVSISNVPNHLRLELYPAGPILYFESFFIKSNTYFSFFLVAVC